MKHRRRSLVFSLLLSIFFIPVSAFADYYLDKIVSRVHESTYEYSNLTDGNSAVYNRDLAIEASILAEQAYRRDIWEIFSQSYDDISIIENGMIVKGSVLDSLEGLVRSLPQIHAPDTDGFTAVKDIVVDGQAKKMIVVSIAGTDELGDWGTNAATYTGASGIHSGFAQNMHGIKELENDIQFNSLGKSLKDIINECIQGSDEYLILVTGHSLGAATANLYAHELYNMGVPAESLVAYTFAAPTTVSNDYFALKINYPIFNIINEADVITGIGADFFSTGRLGTDIAFSLSPEYLLSVQADGLLRNHKMNVYQQIVRDYMPGDRTAEVAVVKTNPPDKVALIQNLVEAWNQDHGDIVLKNTIELTRSGDKNDPTMKAYISGGALVVEIDQYERPSEYGKKWKKSDYYWARSEILYGSIPAEQTALYESFLVDSTMQSLELFYPSLTVADMASLRSQIESLLRKTVAGKIDYASAEPLIFGDGYLVIHYGKWGSDVKACIDIRY